MKLSINGPEEFSGQMSNSFFERLLLHAVPWMDLNKRDVAESATK